MDPETRKRVASLGGKSHSREHLSRIGKLGGTSVSQDREHMSEIGKKGGSNSRKRKS
jgi:general stress protein YciG